MKKINYIVLALTLVVVSAANAQEVRVIDNKGTKQTIRNNQVTVSNTAPTNPLEGDVWYDSNTTPIIVKIWNEPSGQWEEVPGLNNFWSLTGNSATNPTSNFIGTIDAQDLVFRTGNVERMRLRSNAGQLLVNQAPVFNNHPVVIRANGNDILAFQDASGTPQWHWNLNGNGLNFVESGVEDYRLFLEDGGNVGINTDDPTEFLDVNGGARVRTLPTVTTDLDIVIATATGVLQKKPFLAAETDNQLELGANGGVYLGPTVYTGFFIIDNTTLTATGTYSQTISDIPFEPSQITFSAHPNIGSFNLNEDNALPDTPTANSDNNTSLLENSFGAMNGFARNDSPINQAVIYSGASGSSLNNISRYSNNTQCIGLRYTDNDGDNLGVISASVTLFNATGFVLNVNYVEGTTGNANQRDDILDESVIIMYTAYK